MSIRKINESNIASKTLRSTPVTGNASTFIAYGGGNNSSTVPFVFAWTNASGIGTKYANPAQTMNGTFIAQTQVNPTGKAIGYYLSGGTEYNAIYAFDSVTGYGSKFAAPSGFASNISGEVIWSADNKAVSFGSTTNNLGVYAWNDTTGVGTKFTNPSSFASDTNPRAMSFNVSLNILAQASAVSPFIHAWSFNTTTGFGAKFANPSTLPNGDSATPTFSGSRQRGNALHFTLISGSPYAVAYAMTSSGFGTRYSNPSTPIATSGISEESQFNPTGTVIGYSAGASPFIAAYTWTDAAGWGTRYSDPSSLAGASTAEFSWSNDGAAVIASRTVANSGIYAFTTASGFGTKYANPSASGFTFTVGACFSRNYEI